MNQPHHWGGFTEDERDITAGSRDPATAQTLCCGVVRFGTLVLSSRPYVVLKVRTMHLTYDPDFNIAYIRFRSKRAKVRTIAVSDELNVDLDPDGRI
jgi:hypothetical protein